VTTLKLCGMTVLILSLGENMFRPTKSTEQGLSEKLIVPHLVNKIIRMLENTVGTRPHTGYRCEPAAQVHTLKP